MCDVPNARPSAAPHAVQYRPTLFVDYSAIIRDRALCGIAGHCKRYANRKSNFHT
jgi:hypothetical protein